MKVINVEDFVHNFIAAETHTQETIIAFNPKNIFLNAIQLFLFQYIRKNSAFA